LNQAQIAAAKCAVNEATLVENRLHKRAVSEYTIEELAGVDMDMIQLLGVENLIVVTFLGGYFSCQLASPWENLVNA
jgi:hypothetical protein